MRLRLLAVLLAACLGLGCLGLGLSPSRAQAPAGPPSVGVVRVEKLPITETTEFVGRIQATDRVNLIARVTAFLEERHVHRGHRGDKGRPALRAGAAAIPGRPRGQGRQRCSRCRRSCRTQPSRTVARLVAAAHAGRPAIHVDDARATMLSDAAQVLAAQAQQKQSEINLGYTEIHAPIRRQDRPHLGHEGNVVSPSSGTLATIVSQDPMYVVFPVSVRTDAGAAATLRRKGGFSAVVIRMRLPDGHCTAGRASSISSRQHRRAHHRHRHPARLDPQPATRPRHASGGFTGARVGRWRIRDRAARGGRAGGTAVGAARGGAVRPAGRLRLYRRCRQQGAAAHACSSASRRR
jgi:hypothetical protein